MERQRRRQPKFFATLQHWLLCIASENWDDPVAVVNPLCERSYFCVNVNFAFVTDRAIAIGFFTNTQN